NQILRQIVTSMQEQEIWITMTWIPTKENLADDLSRGIFKPQKKLLQYTPKIPMCLKPYVSKLIDYHNTRLCK
ncbi:hypothetical protein IW261DRAFT_1335359, partial [Armillaria novae-zelandiae]